MEALEAVKNTASAKFDETVDMAVKLGVDPRHGDQMVRGNTTLPHGTGKVRKVAVITQGDAVAEAEAAGADRVGGEDLVKDIQGGWADFDVLLCTPDVMGMVGKLGSILRAKMPSKKAGTVAPDIGRVVKEIKSAARVEYRVEKTGIVHAPHREVLFYRRSVSENLNALIDALGKGEAVLGEGPLSAEDHGQLDNGPGCQYRHQ